LTNHEPDPVFYDSEFNNGDKDVTSYAAAVSEGKKFAVKTADVPKEMDSSNSPFFMALDDE